jgi:hypothetical protein
MAELSKLTAGGAHKEMSAPYPDNERGTFVTHTFPCVFDNTIVVAATHPTVSTGSQFEDGWFLSDFYAFNYLLKGSVADQVWLTAAEPSKLLKKHGPYYHGPTSECPKVVLAPELLETDITPVTVVPPAKMIDKFLNEVSKAAARAKDGQPILLMVFCHGSDDHQLLLDNGNSGKGLSLVRLQGALGNARATLLVTACYSGGWVVAPDFNSTTLAAATPLKTSLSFPLSASLGRACGSIFAGAIINALSNVSSPLLAEEEAQKEQNESTERLQPDEPTEIQTETYNEFCRSVTTVLKARGISGSQTDAFCFSAQDDRWTFSWSRRTAIPLARFKERWDNLPTYPRQVFPDASSAESVSLPGGVQFRDQEHARVYRMVQEFRQFCCPGDWQGGYENRVAARIQWFLKGESNAPPLSYFTALIEFRQSACRVADRFVQVHNLSRPNGESCILCDLREFHFVRRKGDRAWDDRQGLVWRMLRDGGAFIVPAAHQGPPRFNRPSDYVSYAIAETYHTPDTEEEACRTAQAYCDYVQSQKQYFFDEAIRSSDIRHKGRDWLRSIGRKIRSFSPVKGSRSVAAHGKTQNQPLGTVEAPSLPAPSRPGPVDDLGLDA